MAASNDSQNVWFGVAMFLIGLIVGAILAIAGMKGLVTVGSRLTAPTPSAGSQQPQAPVVSAKDKMISIIKKIGIDEDAFATCLASDKYNEKINSQMAGGQKAGVNGTPGTVLVDLKTKKTRLISGALPYDQFKKEIDDLMAGKVQDQTIPFEAVDFEKDHVRGDKTARIAAIEYSDFECPFCHRVHPSLQKVFETYKGEVAWIYRHYPLNFHPDAMPYAVGSECVAELAGPEAFWKFTDAVMGQ